MDGGGDEKDTLDCIRREGAGAGGHLIECEYL